jgi:hypothetical protein
LHAGSYVSFLADLRKGLDANVPTDEGQAEAQALQLAALHVVPTSLMAD